METVKNKIAQNFGGKAQDIGTSQFSLDDVPDLTGKVAVVTGGSEGVGYGVTHTLLKHGISKLFITSVRQEKGEDAQEAIAKELGEEYRNKIVYIQNDQSDWTATAKMVSDQIVAKTDKVHILVCNAARGIMTRQLAETNGIDLHMATNHFGHEVIVSHLLPVLKKTADAGETVRIALLSSNLHESSPSETKFASVEELNEDYGPNAQYARSKLANLLHARYLHRHLHKDHPNILINATHPGIVDTAQTTEHIHEAYPLLGYGMSVVMKPFQKSQFQGCVSTCYAATTVKESGLYITPPNIVEKGSDASNDEALQDQLMKLTRQVVESKTRSQSSQKGCPFHDS